MARVQCKMVEAGASKAGEWLRKHPKGLGVTINDMRAVMRLENWLRVV